MRIAQHPSERRRGGVRILAFARHGPACGGVSMARSRRHIFLGLVIAILSWPIPGNGQSGAKSGEWRAYGGDDANTHYSPLDQLNRDTVKNLQVAWTFKF